MASPAPHRDASIDLLRVVCTIVVVALHATMAGIVISGGDVVIVNALETAWFWPASWLVQIMPLFFLAGGVTVAASFRRHRAAGGSTATFAAGRVTRLLPAGIVAIALTAVGLAAMAAVGVPGVLVAEAGFRISQPLWFLGVYLLVQSLAAVMIGAHERRPVLTIALLAGAAVAVDATRLATGVEGVGFVNLAVVWLLIQQIGFFLADGRFAVSSVRARAGLAGGALILTALLAAAGVFSPDMYVNLNPPTTALVLLGTAQACLFSLAQPFLRGLAATRPVARVIDFVGRRAMAIYVWHMPAIVLLSGALIAISFAMDITMPTLYAADWWATRPVWILAVAALTLVLCRFAPTLPNAAAARFLSRRRAAGASVLAVASIAVLFVLGLDVASAVLCVALGACALHVVGSGRTDRGKTPAHVVGHPYAAVAA